VSGSASAEFRAGSVLGQSFKVLGGNPLPFLTTSLLLVAPLWQRARFHDRRERQDRHRIHSRLGQSLTSYEYK
jgi:hypothetical protein